MKWQNKSMNKIIEHNKLSNIIVPLFSLNLLRIQSILVLTDYLKHKANSLLFVKCDLHGTTLLFFTEVAWCAGQ